jgi:hypothetical protein
MIRSMEGFTFASALDLNMGYYHIKLDADTQKLCTQTLTHWYQEYPVSVVFLNIMSKLVKAMEYFKTIIYLDDLLIITNSCFKDHLLRLEMVLARLSAAGKSVNISKSNFFAGQIEYLAS